MPAFWRECVVCGHRWWRKWPQVNCPRPHAIDPMWLNWLQEQYETRETTGSYGKGQRVILRMVARRMAGEQ